MKVLFIVLFSIFLSGCATAYQPSGMTGGFVEEHLEGDIYKMSFGGNGYTTRDTVQVYWLYRCAEFTLEKGFDGFTILSPIQFSSYYKNLPIQSEEAMTRKASMVFIPMDSGPKPAIEADIQLLRAPVTHAPPKVFDAKLLKEALKPHVFGKKCEMGNVCSHVKTYLYGDQIQHKGI